MLEHPLFGSPYPTQKGGAMATFILTWNPDQWNFAEGRYDELVESTTRGESPLEDWSVGVRRGGVTWGDRAFLLLRQHRERGIVASGQFTSEVYRLYATKRG